MSEEEEQGGAGAAGQGLGWAGGGPAGGPGQGRSEGCGSKICCWLCLCTFSKACVHWLPRRLIVRQARLEPQPLLMTSALPAGTNLSPAASLIARRPGALGTWRITLCCPGSLRPYAPPHPPSALLTMAPLPVPTPHPPCRFLLDHCKPDLDFITKMIDPAAVGRLQAVASTPFKRITYTEAIALLEEVVAKGTKQFEFKVCVGGGAGEAWRAQECARQLIGVMCRVGGLHWRRMALAAYPAKPAPCTDVPSRLLLLARQGVVLRRPSDFPRPPLCWCGRCRWSGALTCPPSTSAT